jgi:hypothetical protein
MLIRNLWLRFSYLFSRIFMTTPDQTSDAVKAYEQKQQQDKEYNFAMLNKKLQAETQARMEAEKRAEEAVKAAQQRQTQDDDDDGDEPYVDHKRLNKKLSNFEKTMEQKIEQKAEVIARAMVEQQKHESWLKANPDFKEVIEQYADKFAAADPDLAESILEMPNTFERQKLVYKNIKALGLHKPPVPQQSIQDKIDANRRSPYYQPSGVGTAPYSGQGDFSQSGQKNAYDKMKELQNKLRLR